MEIEIYDDVVIYNKSEIDNRETNTDATKETHSADLDTVNAHNTSEEYSQLLNPTLAKKIEAVGFDINCSYSDSDIKQIFDILKYRVGKRSSITPSKLHSEFSSYNDFNDRKEALVDDLKCICKKLDNLINSYNKLNIYNCVRNNNEVYNHKFINKINSIKIPKGVSRRFSSAVIGKVLSISCVDSESTPKSIVDSILKSSPGVFKSNFNYNELVQYVKSVMYAYSNEEKNGSNANFYKKENKLDKIQNELLDLIKTAQVGKLDTIVQITPSGKRYKCKCSCGNHLEITRPVAQIIILNSVKIARLSDIFNKIAVVPIKFTCDCGMNYILSSDKLVDIIIDFVNKNTNNMSIVGKNDVVYLNIGLDQRVFKYPFIISNEVDVGSNTTEQDDIYIDHFEMKKAAEEFSRRVLAFSNIKTPNKQAEYSHLAKYVCRMVGLDYNKEKLKCIYSLICWVFESKYLSKYLDIRNTIRINSDLYNMKCIIGSEKIDTWCSRLLKQYDFSVEERIECAKKKLRELNKELEDIVSAKEVIIDKFEKNINLLAFVKSINISYIDYEKYLAIMTDERLQRLIEQAADRMIVTNSADNTAKVIARKTNCKSNIVQLGNSITKKELQENLIALLKSMKRNNPYLGFDVEYVVSRYFDLLNDISVVNLESVSKLASKIHSSEYMEIKTQNTFSDLSIFNGWCELKDSLSKARTGIDILHDHDNVMNIVLASLVYEAKYDNFVIAMFTISLFDMMYQSMNLEQCQKLLGYGTDILINNSNNILIDKDALKLLYFNYKTELVDIVSNTYNEHILRNIKIGDYVGQQESLKTISSLIDDYVSESGTQSDIDEIQSAMRLEYENLVEVIEGW